MHTWALFSCSSLITLTAYNLSQLPKDAAAGPQPEPDGSEKFAEDGKFSLETVSNMFPTIKPTAELPPLPTQPQLSKIDELAGYNPAIYDPVDTPVREIDLFGALPKSSAELPSPDPVLTFRTNAIKPLPSAIPAPLPAPLPVRTAAIAAPRPIAQPQLEQPATTPVFARDAEPAVAQVPTRPSDLPTVPIQATPSAASGTTPTPLASAANSPELFAGLPEATVPIRAAAPTKTEGLSDTEADMVTETTVAASQPSVTNATMMAWVDFEPSSVIEATPEATMSMELALTQQELIERYCDRPQSDRNEATSAAVCEDDTNELAQSIPEAATAGTPIPGNVESPVRSSPLMGVE